MLNRRLLYCVCFSCLCWVLARAPQSARAAAAAAAGTPSGIGQIISYQGLLRNADGTAVADGPQTLTFTIYASGHAVFTQTAPVATVGGVFNAFLSVGVLTFYPSTHYDLGITFNGVEV